MEHKKFKMEYGGRELTAEFGKFAGQADGAVAVTYGGTTVLATAVMEKKPKEGADYLPLMVSFEEKYYAGGKIKGSRFVKREGRPSDESILVSRLIDRPLRPLFNQAERRDIQVVATVLSIDRENDPDIVALIAASLALRVSPIPWNGPIGACRVGYADGSWVLNPTCAIREKSPLDLVVVGTASRVNMLEGNIKEMPEDKVSEAIKFAHNEMQKIIKFQEEAADALGARKMETKISEPKGEAENSAKEFLKDKLEAALYHRDKIRRVAAAGELKDALGKFIGEKYPDNPKHIQVAMNVLEEETNRLLHENILKSEKRPDGRKIDELRDIVCEVGLLPRVHGSALFNRGDTQALSVLTLGGPGAEQIVENMDKEYKKHFMHHYNFPPYSVGEVAPMRGPGRREIGHGALAERALETIMPPKEEFPYTIRLVSEILSSNGSSSMASVCGSCLALMDGGVPIKNVVGGIAMGLVMSDEKNFKILTDIQGPEDHHGDMDLKFAGTDKGLVALQMDVKVEGVTVEILDAAFRQGRKALNEILGKMKATISAPRQELSLYAPRIIIIQIDPEKIRNVIGPGGKIINQIIDETGVEIDIEDSGLVFITSANKESAEKAREWVNNLTREVKPGELFQGRVTRILNFGAFVEILPNQEGLVHISELADYRVARVEDIVHVGDIIPVKVRNIDDQGRINLSLKDAMNQKDGQADDVEK